MVTYRGFKIKHSSSNSSYVAYPANKKVKPQNRVAISKTYKGCKKEIDRLKEQM